MKIKFVESGGVHAANKYLSDSYPVLILERDGWNDFSFRTLSILYIIRRHGDTPELIGTTKVMYRGQDTGSWTFDAVSDVDGRLGLQYCSISTDTKYYEALVALGRTLGSSVLTALRDAAFNPAVWRRFENELCFKTSLLRETSYALRARDIVPHLFGRAKRFVRKFSFIFRVGNQLSDAEARFDFRKMRRLPHRIELVVGPNGSGKTQLLSGGRKYRLSVGRPLRGSVRSRPSALQRFA